MKKSLFLMFLFLSFSGSAQNRNIFWNSSRLLQWTDFTGTPNHNNTFHANTNSGITYSWSYKAGGDEVNFAYEVYSFFIPEGSWVRPGKSSQHLLAHEQLHFDITELYARKLRQKLKDFDAAAVKDLKKVLKEIYDTIDAERKAMQEKYDLETDHSQRANIQLEWQNKVKEDLAELEEFSS